MFPPELGRLFKTIAIIVIHKLIARVLDVLISKMWMIRSWLCGCLMIFKWSRMYTVDSIFLILLDSSFLFFFLLILSFCPFSFSKPDNRFTKVGWRVIKNQAMFALWAKALNNRTILSLMRHELFPLTFLFLIIRPSWFHLSSRSGKQEDPREGTQIALESILVLQRGRKARH